MPASAEALAVIEKDVSVTVSPSFGEEMDTDTLTASKSSDLQLSDGTSFLLMSFWGVHFYLSLRAFSSVFSSFLLSA